MRTVLMISTAPLIPCADTGENVALQLERSFVAWQQERAKGAVARLNCLSVHCQTSL